MFRGIEKGWRKVVVCAEVSEECVGDELRVLR